MQDQADDDKAQQRDAAEEGRLPHYSDPSRCRRACARIEMLIVFSLINRRLTAIAQYQLSRVAPKQPCVGALNNFVLDRNRREDNQLR